MSIHVFFTLYTTLPHNIFKEKLTELIEQILYREGSLNLTCIKKNIFSPLENRNEIDLGHLKSL